jgi:hypothetical protein
MAFDYAAHLKAAYDHRAACESFVITGGPDLIMARQRLEEIGHLPRGTWGYLEAESLRRKLHDYKQAV